MNTGIQDAVNLRWKLAYVLNGAGDSDLLLDSYEAERRPIARAVIAAAALKQHLSFGASTLTSRIRSMAVSIFGNIPAVHRKLQVELSETEFAYRDGPLVALAAGKLGGQRTDVGTRARDAVAQAGDTLQVLRLGSSQDPDGEVRTRYRLNGPGWVLVRPDQVVAARGVGADFTALHAYAARVLRPKPAA